ncbi:MAG: YihY/virulence factor BrkB family protein [Halolamina sp.]
MSRRVDAASPVAFARRVFAVAAAGDVSFLAAGVAYYAFVSLLPAVLLALIVAGAVGGETLTTAVFDAVGALLTDSGRAVVERAVDPGFGRGSVTAVGVAVLVWGALKVFRALDTAFARLYGVATDESSLAGVVDAAVVFASVGLGFALTVAVGAALATLRFGPVPETVGLASLPVALTVAFLPMFVRFPDAPVTLRAALPGAAVAGVGWTLLQAGFRLYASVAGADPLGVVGGVVLLVTWLYLAAGAVLVGASVNVARAHDVGQAIDADAGRPTASRSVDARGVTGADRQVQGSGRPSHGRMSGDRDSGGAPDVAELAAEVERLRDAVDDVEDRTVEKPELEAELKRYVRRQRRRGHARGWGPYLVLGYGTALALGAFYLLDGWPAVAAMFVAFTSTLGLYALFVLVGVGLNTLGLGGRALSFVREFRR